jgi:hypothetical protein
MPMRPQTATDLHHPAPPEPPVVWTAPQASALDDLVSALDRALAKRAVQGAYDGDR